MRIGWPSLLVLWVFLLPSAAFAQDAEDRGTVGVFVAYPGSIGVTWNVSSRVAIRPDAFFSHTWNDSRSVTSTGTSSSTTDNIGFGIAALFHVRQHERLRVYVVPRFEYARTTGDSQASVIGSSSTATASSHMSASNYEVSGSLGAEHPISRRFAVFAELGLAYARVLTTSSRLDVTQGSETTMQAFGTRASVGTIIYF